MTGRRATRSRRLRGALPAVVLVLVAMLGACTVGASPSGSSDPGASASAGASQAAGASADPSGSPKPDRARGDLKDWLRAGLGRGSRGGVAGPITITAVSGSSISLRTADGWTRTITVTADTEISKGGSPITAAELQVGDEVRLHQRKLDDGSYEVTAIAVIVPVVRGSVTAVTSASLTLEQRGGATRTVTLTATTAYRVGDAATTSSAVRVGSVVTVAGTEGAGGAFTALTVNIRPDVNSGEVTSKASDSLVLRRRDGTSVTVHVDATTRYRVRGVDEATLADIEVGTRVSAAGLRRDDGSLDADLVAARRSKDKQDPSPAPSPSG